MKAGLLICDHVNKEYQSRFGDYPDMFATLFPELKFIHYDVCNGHFPNDIEECDLYMTTGSSHSAYENLDWINKVKDFIRAIYKRDKYFIGICFGHQLMAEALGGKVEKAAIGWCVGVHEFEILERKNWMTPFENPINILMMCQDQIVKLPESVSVFAENKKCPIGMLQLGSKMLGIQGHPEFTEEYVRFLIELRRDRMGQAVVELGLKSLDLEVHQKLISDWVINFINRDGGK